MIENTSQKEILESLAVLFMILIPASWIYYKFGIEIPNRIDKIERKAKQASV